MRRGTCQASSDKGMEAEKNHMKRKITVLALSAMLFALCASAEAQQPAKVHKIGVLRADSPPNLSAETFQQAMRDLGYVEGKNIFIEYRYAEGKVDRLPELAEELVRLNVDVIWALGPAVPHAKNATKTIPIVITHVSDPVASGLVASLAQPGGNITGLSGLSTGLSGKRLELLKEVIPKRSRVALFGNSTIPGNVRTSKEMERDAGELGVKLQYLDVRSLKEIEPALLAASKGRAQAVLINRNPVTAIHYPRIAELA